MEEGKDYAMVLRDNPLLAKAQQSLKEQLLKRKRELEEKLHERSFVLKTSTKKREDAGVKMYGLQKTLATLQQNLEYANENLATISDGHAKADEELSVFQEQHHRRISELSTQKEKMEKLKQELNVLGESLKKVEEHNSKLKSDIAVSRRVTYATEENISKAEKEKSEQDLFIAHLQKEIKLHNDKKEMVQAKLSAQVRETQVARDALSEAQIEMESINSEKKQIMAQWKSSLIVLARCDEALQALHDGIDQQKQQEASIHGEKQSLRKAIKNERVKLEAKVSTLTSIESRIKTIEKKMQQNVARRLKILEEYTKVLLSVQDLEGKVDKVTKETAIVNLDIKEVEKQIQKESEDLMNLEDNMIKRLGDQVTFERSHQKLANKIMSTRKEIKKEDMIATELEFELAQIRNDILKVTTYNKNVRNALCDVESEIKKKLLIISKMDLEIKRKRADVDVKTKEIDRLNKQYDKLTMNFADKDQTPWDHMIAHITSEIIRKSKESTRLQKQWLAMQSELVNLSGENNSLSEKTQKLENEKVALVQRNKRLEVEISILTTNMKDIEHATKVNHNMIIRFNDLIAKNTILQQFLENENFNTHTSNLNALKDLEQKLVELESLMIDTLKEREALNAEVAELQHHVKLWTSKIAFEKQTQDTFMKAIIGPMAMLASLKKETERSKLKLDNLKCIRDKKLASVETRVCNRKAIYVKVQAVSQKKPPEAKKEIEEALHARLIADLRRQMRETTKNKEMILFKISGLEIKRDTLKIQVEALDEGITKMSKQQEDLRLKLKEAYSKKTYHLLATALQQRMVKRHTEFKTNKWKVKIKVSLNEDYNDSLKKCTSISDLVQTFLRDLPDMQFKLEPIHFQLTLAISPSP